MNSNLKMDVKLMNCKDCEKSEYCDKILLKGEVLSKGVGICKHLKNKDGDD